MFVIKKLIDAWNHFFHRHEDLSIFGPIRIAFSILLLINVLLWWPELEKWFGENGVMTFEISKLAIDPDTYTIFQWLPKTTTVLWSCYLLMIANLIALMVGFLPRIQLACIFVLFTSFCHRNNLIFDGEDSLFRMFTFYLFFAPVGKYLSVHSWLARRRATDSDGLVSSEPKKFAIWPLRLIQIQTAAIVFISGIEKMKGVEWRDGTALYYVSRLDDFFYRFPVPEFMFNSFLMIAIGTWSAVLIELTLPILVWFRKTRMLALVVLFLFHLSLEYMMNLNMFQWLMIVGWMSFLQFNRPQTESSEPIVSEQAVVEPAVE